MKKLKLIDIAIIVAFILALIVGFLTYKHFRQTADKQFDKKSKIAFQVFLRGVTITGKESPIKPGDKTFITIRNVPYTELQIVDSKIETKKVVMPNPAGKPQFILIDDYSQLFMYDIIVTIVDNAKITKDGPVVGGNKIKIGMPITLEGKNYKLTGTVSDIKYMLDSPMQSNIQSQQPNNQTMSTKPVNSVQSDIGTEKSTPSSNTVNLETKK